MTRNFGSWSLTLIRDEIPGSLLKRLCSNEESFHPRPQVARWAFLHPFHFYGELSSGDISTGWLFLDEPYADELFFSIPLCLLHQVTYVRNACLNLSRASWLSDRAKKSTLCLVVPNLNLPRTTSLPRRFDNLSHRLELDVARDNEFLSQTRRPSSSNSPIF